MSGHWLGHPFFASTAQSLIRAVVAATPRPFLQGIYDFACEQLIHDRVAIIGDAAFTARPHVGMGVSKAAEDAATLADALAAGDQASALAEWQRQRVRYGRAVVDWGRDLGSYLGPQPDNAEHRARAAHFRSPEILLTATATTDPHAHLQI